MRIFWLGFFFFFCIVNNRFICVAEKSDSNAHSFCFPMAVVDAAANDRSATTTKYLGTTRKSVIFSRFLCAFALLRASTHAASAPTTSLRLCCCCAEFLFANF